MTKKAAFQRIKASGDVWTVTITINTNLPITVIFAVAL